VKQAVLVGLMGSGKSTIGQIIAERTGRSFVDVDVAIAARTGQAVRQLWEEGGEAAYQHLQSEEVLQTLCAGAPVVLAAPDGVILDPAVRSALQDAFVVWLRASPATLADRVRPGDHRPFLGDHPYEALSAMADSRSGLHGQVAHAVVDTDGVAPEAAADIVVNMVASSTAVA